jgi:TonB family protein
MLFRFKRVETGAAIWISRLALTLIGVLFLGPAPVWAAEGDRATHRSDHSEDPPDIVLPEVHVHGLPLNKDQQLGPVPVVTLWPKIPASLDGQELDDWMKARMLVSKDATVSVVVLEAAKHRELTVAAIEALKKWKFDPQLRGDEPIDGELTIRIHFRSQ